MKLTRNHLMIGLLAIVTIMAIAAMLGHSLLSPDVLSGLSLLPFAMSGEIDLKSITEALKNQGDELKDWRDKHDQKLKTLESDIADLAVKANRPNINGKGGDGPGEKAETWYDPATKSQVLVLNNNQLLSSLKSKEDGAPSLGRLLRGIVLGSRADDAKVLETGVKAMGVSNLDLAAVSLWRMGWLLSGSIYCGLRWCCLKPVLAPYQ